MVGILEPTLTKEEKRYQLVRHTTYFIPCSFLETYGEIEESYDNNDEQHLSYLMNQDLKITGEQRTLDQHT